MTKGYRRFCSTKCSTNDPETKASMVKGLRTDDSKLKRKETLIKIHGTDSMISIHKDKAIATRLKRIATNYWNNLADPADDITPDDLARRSIYVYAYLNPLKPISSQVLQDMAAFELRAIDYEPFYIGYGTYKRAGAHLGEARKSPASNHKLNTIRGIWNANAKPIIVKLKDVTSKTDGHLLESQLIEAIGTVAVIEGVKRGPLTNQAPGGKGGSHSDETNKKLAELRKGKIWITDGENQKYVPEGDILSWESKGWKRGMKPSAKRDAYFAGGSRTKNTVWINKDGINKRVSSDDIVEHINNGWIIGQLSTNPGQHKRAYVWITDGVESKNVKSTEPIPDGWRLGRVRSKFPDGYKRKDDEEDE
jgi:hypothetical protein